MWSEEKRQKLIKILQEMIRIDTSNLPGNENKMTEYIGAYLDEAKIPYQIIEKENNNYFYNVIHFKWLFIIYIK